MHGLYVRHDRQRRRHILSLTCGYFIGGCLLVGVLLAGQTTLGLVNLPSVYRRVIVVSVAFVSIIMQAKRVPTGLFSFRFVVPSRWVTPIGTRRSGLIWGVILGTGFITLAPYAIFHTLIAVAILSISADVAVVVGMGFAFGRLSAGLIAPLRRYIDARPPLLRPSLFIGSTIGAVLLSACAISTKPANTPLASCKPNSDPVEVSKGFAPLTGPTHVGVVSNNTWNYTIAPPKAYGEQSKWGGNKLLIAVHRSAGPAVTVTGHLLDDPKVELRFGNDPEPVRSRILRLRDSRELDGGWYDFPNAIRAQKIGCYQLRFKSDRLDETLTLRIVSSQ